MVTVKFAADGATQFNFTAVGICATAAKLLGANSAIFGNLKLLQKNKYVLIYFDRKITNEIKIPNGAVIAQAPLLHGPSRFPLEEITVARTNSQ